MNIKNSLLKQFANKSAKKHAAEPDPAIFGFDDDETPAEEAPAAEAPAKRKPGRPRKVAVAAAPKKRGRPRKNPLPAAEVAAPPPAPVVAAAVVKTNSAAIRAKRSRNPMNLSPAAVMPKKAEDVPAVVEAAAVELMKPDEKPAKAKRGGKKGVLAALTPKMPEGEVPPTDAERKAQLRCLVREFQALTDAIRATKQRTGGYTMKETGEFRPSPLSQDQKDVLLAGAAEQEKQRTRVLRQIERILQCFPLYAEFIEKVPGVGVGCAGLLLANIDWTRCEKPSALQRFCGLAVRVDDEGHGKAQRKQAGVKLDFRQEIKTALWHCFGQVMVKAKDGRRVVKEVLDDGTKVYASDDDGNEIRTGGEAVQASPYFRRMVEYKHRLLNSPRYDAEKNLFDGRKGGKAIVHDMTWRPGAQLFLEHLYLIGRTMAGLPVWPDYEAAKLGYGHGGKVCVNAPMMLTLDQAFAVVRGDYKSVSEVGTQCGPARPAPGQTAAAANLAMSAEPPADGMYLLLVTGDCLFKDNRVSAGVLAHVQRHMAMIPDGGLLIYDHSVGGPAWCASKMAEWGDVYRICYRADGKRWGFTGRVPFGQDTWWPHLSFADPTSLAIGMCWRAVQARCEGWTVRGLIYHGWDHPSAAGGLARPTREAWDHWLPPEDCMSVDVNTAGEVQERHEHASQAPAPHAVG